jgi:hypothetical protein
MASQHVSQAVQVAPLTFSIACAKRVLYTLVTCHTELSPQYQHMQQLTTPSSPGLTQYVTVSQYLTP